MYATVSSSRDNCAFTPAGNIETCECLQPGAKCARTTGTTAAASKRRYSDAEILGELLELEALGIPVKLLRTG